MGTALDALPSIPFRSIPRKERSQPLSCSEQEVQIIAREQGKLAVSRAEIVAEDALSYQRATCRIICL
jgi:hypothetical protein